MPHSSTCNICANLCASQLLSNILPGHIWIQAMSVQADVDARTHARTEHLASRFVEQDCATSDTLHLRVANLAQQLRGIEHVACRIAD